jgi:hypothetical protein
MVVHFAPAPSDRIPLRVRGGCLRRALLAGTQVRSPSRRKGQDENGTMDIGCFSRASLMVINMVGQQERSSAGIESRLHSVMSASLRGINQ